MRTNKILMFLLVVSALFAAALFTAAPAFAEDSMLDKAGDWFTTLGMSQHEKDHTLFERRSERAAKKLQQGLNRAGKQAEKDADQLGKGLKKAFQ